jgi:cytochrome c-type biogenesis protein CcmF
MEGGTMIPSTGYLALVMALLLSFVQAFLGIRNQGPRIRGAVTASLLLIIISFGCLVYSHATSDFSVLNVYNNSHTAKPLMYKISGTWGNHEGSMLLIALILAAYNFAFAWLGSSGYEPDDLTTTLPPKLFFKNIILSIQSFISTGFLSFIIFTSNPFERIFPVPENGQGLNPLLQDVGLAIHPPVLYIGYIGLSLALSYSVAALILGEADKKWAMSLKKWVLFSWSFLTFGVGLGSWWAYRELGWGGFWMWDPVENASFMPWLAATALLHSLIVMEKRETLKIWTILLGILTFSLSLVGIFLVRSGVLTSIHAFASDPTRGVFILAFLGLIINVSLILFALRAHKLKPLNDFTPVSKESTILLGNMLLVIACATVLLGTLYPIFLELFSEHRVSVGAPYFNSTFNLIILPVLLLAAISPAIKWKDDSIKILLKKFYNLFTVGITTAALVLLVPEKTSIIAAVAISFSIVLIAAMLIRAYEKLRDNGKLSPTFCAMALSHIGAGVLAIGITVVSVWGIEEERIIKLEESIPIEGYTIKMNEMYFGMDDNFLMRQGKFSVIKNGGELAVLLPEVRYYPVEKSNTTESDIYYTLFSNIYIAMGDSDGKGGFVVRVYYKPMINLVWLGCVLMGAGGLVGLVRKGKG